MATASLTTTQTMATNLLFGPAATPNSTLYDRRSCNMAAGWLLPHCSFCDCTRCCSALLQGRAADLWSDVQHASIMALSAAGCGSADLRDCRCTQSLVTPVTAPLSQMPHWALLPMTVASSILHIGQETKAAAFRTLLNILDTFTAKSHVSPLLLPSVQSFTDLTTTLPWPIFSLSPLNTAY